MTTPVNPLSILSRAAKADLVLSPYPHLAITDAPDPTVFAPLSRESPADDVILNGRPPKDTWLDYPACKVVKDDRVSPWWREFFGYHTSKALFDELVTLARPQLRMLAPDMEKQRELSLEDRMVVGKHLDGRGAALARVGITPIEFHIYLNYSLPPRAASEPHVDKSSELFAVLFNIQREVDDHTGSNLDRGGVKLPKTCVESKLDPIFNRR